jgi:hypothetical protein
MAMKTIPFSSQPLKSQMRPTGFDCMLAFIDNVVSIVIRSDGQRDVEQWRGDTMRSQYLAGLYEKGAVIALKLTIRDPAGEAIEIIPLLNVSDRDDMRLLNELASQDVFHIHCLDSRGRYVFSKQLNQGSEQREIVSQMIEKAQQHNAQCRRLGWREAQQQFIDALKKV